MNFPYLVGLLVLSVVPAVFGGDVRAPVSMNKERKLLSELVENMFPERALRVVGGEPAPPGRYPYMAGLFDGSLPVPECGGTLIAPNVVLSAAHCSTPVFVTIGCQDQDDLTQSGCETIDVQEHFVFPEFSLTGFGAKNDFSVTILVEESSNEIIPYLASSELELAATQKLRVIGFGRTFDLGPFSPVLLEADIDFVPADVCGTSYAEFLGRDPIDDSQLCAGGDRVGACNHDSGGPLMLTCETTGEDLQIGIVSWGVPCATEQYPAVFAKVSFAIDFIRNLVVEQGHSLNTIDSLDDFCLVSGTQSPTATTPPPTAFPAFPIAWSCNASSYSTLDGCNCNCGVPDPDCEPGVLPPQAILGCSFGQVCEEGLCITPPPSPPTPAPVVPGVPPEWICDQFFYANLDGCDCECGAPDPDCEFQPDDILGCEDEEECLEGFCVPLGTTLFPTVKPTDDENTLPPTTSPTKEVISTLGPSVSLGWESRSGLRSALLVVVLGAVTVLLVIGLVVLVCVSQKGSTSVGRIWYSWW